MERLLEKDLHDVPADEVLSLLDVTPEAGLDLNAVADRQQRFGPNSLLPPREKGPILRFLIQFHQPLVYILLAAAVVTALLQEWVDSGVILAVVLVNAVIGFVQETKAASALHALANMTITEARVVRNGATQKIPSSEIVPGDIVLLQSGDKTPADMRLIRSRNLHIDESTLTGESTPTSKSTEPLPHSTPLAERRNLAFASTLVTYGQGRGVVYATGEKTEIGRISDLTAKADTLETPLTLKIASFSRLLLVAILALAAFTFAVGMMKGHASVDMFMASVALAVGAIPEGLPAAVTITLAIGVARMARRQAIIRRLPAVETLGSTTTICSDKTGTLTVNQMTVQEVWAAGQYYGLSGAGYCPDGQIEPRVGTVDFAANRAAQQCLLAGLLCNDSSVVCRNSLWEVIGDPTEGALIVSARKSGLDPQETLIDHPRIDTLPFESEKQYMASLHEEPGASGRVLYVKGGAETVLSMCSHAMSTTGSKAPLDAVGAHAVVDAMAAQGLRVLAFACSRTAEPLDSLSDGALTGLTFLGLQGMMDPPRPESIRAVQACHAAGIRVVMITGDHPSTASAIANSLGLLRPDHESEQLPRVLTSRELGAMTDKQVIEWAARVSVFARATPEQKLRLVRALQATGQVVAMTGDGVNDAPALKQADIGIAMGACGTEVAKEAADMVLTDDNFATIEAAVEEGRAVFDNLTKFIAWTLPTNLGEGLVILAAILAGATLPLLPVQILWINMTTAILLGLTLAFEPKEPGIMRRPPRDPAASILSRELVFRMGIVSLVMLIGAFGAFEWALGQGMNDAAARTVAVNVFVTVEAFYLLNCRSLTKSMFALGVFSNRWILVGVTGMFALQMAFTYTPFLNYALNSAPIGWDAWWRILLTGVAVYIVVGLEKWIRMSKAARFSAFPASH